MVGDFGCFFLSVAFSFSLGFSSVRASVCVCVMCVRERHGLTSNLHLYKIECFGSCAPLHSSLLLLFNTEFSDVYIRKTKHEYVFIWKKWRWYFTQTVAYQNRTRFYFVSNFIYYFDLFLANASGIVFIQFVCASIYILWKFCVFRVAVVDTHIGSSRGFFFTCHVC